MRSSWFAARTRLLRLLLVIRLWACVVGATRLLRLLLVVRLWARVVGASICFRFGSEILIGSTSLIMAASMSIEGRMTWRIGPHLVKTIMEISGTKCSWRVAEAVRGLLRHSWNKDNEEKIKYKRIVLPDKWRRSETGNVWIACSELLTRNVWIACSVCGCIESEQSNETKN